MATTFNGSMNFSFRGYLSKTLDIGTASQTSPYDKKYTINPDTGMMLWTDTRSIGDDSNDDIDLYDNITNAFGDTIEFGNIHGIMMFAHADNAQPLEIGNNENAFCSWLGGNAESKLILPPGGMFCLYSTASNPFTLTSGSADILRVYNPSGTANYDIILFGSLD